MSERTDVITFKGAGLTLLGNPVSAGETAPDFTVLANDLSFKTLADYKGSVLIISAVPSLDTPVCDVETRRFNQEAANLDESIKVLTISNDLPFAQARWCGAAGINAVETLSDHRDLAFGNAYGLVIKELRLLARAVLVLDKEGKIVYQEIVPEVTDEPNYDAAIAAAKAAL